MPEATYNHSSNYCENIILGAGPIGVELAANFRLLGLEYVQFDAGELGHTISRWPRSTPFFSSPERVAIAGVPLHSTHQRMLTGEEYLAYLRTVVEFYDLDIRLWHRVTSAGQRPGGGFALQVEHKGIRQDWSCERLFLCHGNMHTPRRLGVPGEDLGHVDHYPIDVHRYFRQRLLVVGGRNSAVEAAIRSWRAGAEVTLLHRGPALEKQRLNSRYHLEISILIDKGKIGFLPGRCLSEIRRDSVRHQPYGGSAPTAGGAYSQLGSGAADAAVAGAPAESAADFVLVCAGFEKDLSLLTQLEVPLADDTQPHIDMDTMESAVAGLFFAGTAVSGGLDSYRTFVGTSHVHVGNIIRRLTGEQARLGDYHRRVYPFSQVDIAPTEGSGD